MLICQDRPGDIVRESVGSASYDRGDHPSSSRPRPVHTACPEVVLAAEVERFRIGVPDLGTDHEDIAELMAPPDGVARVVRAEAERSPSSSRHHSLRTVK